MKIELQQAFETLGVPVGSPASDVRSAYRTLIRTNHPDRVKGDTVAATQRLAEINAAKDLIDRTPLVEPVRPQRPANKQERPAETPTQTLTPEQQRVRREAEARAFRKSMEARANAEAQAELRARASTNQANSARGHMLDRDEAEERAREEARRLRQAAFAAAVRGETANEGRGSFLGRLRALGSR